MERRFATPFERGVTTTVNDVEHIESQSLAGISVVKIFFQRGAEIESAVAQLSGRFQQYSCRIMPPGSNPPFIIRYNAANVPVLQLALGGEGLSEQELSDLGTNGIRTRLATGARARVCRRPMADGAESSMSTWIPTN
jgi:multidrug efflux pump subunit AcrB